MGKPPEWDKATSPFHPGELEIQERLGVKEKMDTFARRIVRSFLPEQHRQFHASLPIVFFGYVDEHGRTWASAIAGEPGFFSAPDPHTLRLTGRPVRGDPLADALRPGLPLGMLGIALGTRRRNRVNGHVRSVSEGVVEIDVDQTFGNCPQYIQTREHRFIRSPEKDPDEVRIDRFSGLDQAARSLISRSDTFWVASSSDNAEADTRVNGADVSHRGGQPGFVKVDGNTLTVPDFAGNLHFNTLGNFLVNPSAGLLFIDFERGDVLMLTGTAEVLFEGPEVDAFRGAERAWRFTAERGLRLYDALPLRWAFDRYSPNTLLTGDWTEAESILAAEQLRHTWRPYRVTRIQDESPQIRSFYLEPDDGKGLFAFEAGQYLTLRVSPPLRKKPLIRTYTLSSAPHDRFYRISVKREPRGTGPDAGSVSNFLHDEIRVGDIIEAKAPRGDFFIDPDTRRPAVLVAGGVGVTPMISMARHVAHEGLRTRYRRPLTVFHASRTAEARAFAGAFRELEAAGDGDLRYVSVLSSPEGDADFDATGRIDADLLRAHLALDDYDFYVCGPPGFMQSVYDAARSLGVPDGRIFAESFGPASLKRRPDEVRSPWPTFPPSPNKAWSDS